MSQHHLRIVVVEDDDLAAVTLCRVLERAGHAVERFGTVGGAAEAMQARLPDAVFVDRKLPDGDGLGVLRGLERLPARIVVLSGEPELHGVPLPDRAVVLRKPIGIRELLAVLE